MNPLTTTDIIADIRRLVKHHEELWKLAHSQEEAINEVRIINLLDTMSKAYKSGRTVTREATA